MEWLNEAILLEKKGEREQASRLYHKLLALGQSVQEARIGIVRTRHQWLKFEGVSLEEKLFFQEAQGERQLQEFERWLIK
ncbi:hypothetical protein [uncultured Helicobacter sp.]|uniref:hypothetical protein n=1 Tax=uncultured Helicobacter sp. TaxID=175537 RepID=UPI001F88D7E5|nr:hypothetical protein [uncultured Helicobacter sp.]HIY44788.1 hypothetical protein [Candidatus Helicobacter avistercoris]